MPKNKLKLRINSDIIYIRNNYGNYLKGDITIFPIIKSLLRNCKNSTKIKIIINKDDNLIMVMDDSNWLISDSSLALSSEFIVKDLLNKDIDKNKNNLDINIVCYLVHKVVISNSKVDYIIENDVIYRNIKHNILDGYNNSVTLYINNKVVNFNINTKMLIEYINIMKNKNNISDIILYIDGKIISTDNLIIKRKRKQKVLNGNKIDNRVVINNIDDKWTIGKPYIETIYVNHVDELCCSIGNICHVYGKNEELLNARIDIISSIPELLEYFKLTNNLFISTSDNTKFRYNKKVLKLINNLKTKLKL